MLLIQMAHSNVDFAALLDRAAAAGYECSTDCSGMACRWRRSSWIGTSAIAELAFGWPEGGVWIKRSDAGSRVSRAIQNAPPARGLIQVATVQSLMPQAMNGDEPAHELI